MPRLKIPETLSSMSLLTCRSTVSVACSEYGVFKFGAVNWIVDADIRAFFDSIDHDWTMRFVEHRVGDRRVLRLIDGGRKRGDRITPADWPYTAEETRLLAMFRGLDQHDRDCVLWLAQRLVFGKSTGPAAA